jgi:hypothetical protein
MPARLYWLQLYPEAGGSVIPDRKEGFGVASGVRDACEIACAWTGIAWTLLDRVFDESRRFTRDSILNMEYPCGASDG